MKKYVWWSSAMAVALVVGAFLLGKFVFPSEKLPALPASELSEGQRGERGDSAVTLFIEI